MWRKVDRFKVRPIVPVKRQKYQCGRVCYYPVLDLITPHDCMKSVASTGGIWGLDL